jgi:hypothetical protein
MWHGGCYTEAVSTAHALPEILRQILNTHAHRWQQCHTHRQRRPTLVHVATARHVRWQHNIFQHHPTISIERWRLKRRDSDKADVKTLPRLRGGRRSTRSRRHRSEQHWARQTLSLLYAAWRRVPMARDASRLSDVQVKAISIESNRGRPDTSKKLKT